MVNATLQYGMWLLGPALHMTVAGLVIWRRLHGEFPAFLAYTLFHAVKSGVLFLLFRWDYASYSYVYWYGELVSLVLGILVIQELYSNVFRQYEGLQQLGNALFRWAMVILLLLVVVTESPSPTAYEHPTMAALLVFQRGLRVLQDGLLVLLFILASCLGLRFRHFALGIALGFALFVSVDLAALAARVHFGQEAGMLYALIRPVAYNCSLTVWVVYLLKASPERASVDELPATALEKWNDAILELWRR